MDIAQNYKNIQTVIYGMRLNKMKSVIKIEYFFLNKNLAQLKWKDLNARDIGALAAFPLAV